MHVDLIATTKGTKMIHGTDNGKKTACGINLTRPENVGLYTTAGEMNDIIQLTCEKCKTLIAKKQIKEANKEMAAQLKAEAKALKRERALEKHGHAAPPPPPPAADSGKSGAYVPPSMRKSMAEQEKQKPIDAPAPEVPKPASMPAPNVAPAPIPAPAPAPKDDVLAQFAIPTVPSALPGAVPPPAMPEPAPAPAPASVSTDDVLAQFAIPTVPTSLPGAAAKSAAGNADDLLAQFSIPKPGAQPAPASVSAPTTSQEDILAQFSQTPAPDDSLDSVADTLFSAPDAAAAPGTVTVEIPAEKVPASAQTAAERFGEDAEEIIEVTPTPVADDFDPFAILRQPAPPSAPAPAVSDSLDDLMVMPADMQTRASAVPPALPETPAAPSFPTLAEPTVPTAPPAPTALPTLNVPSAPVIPAAAAVPTLNVPQAPPAPPVPEMPVPPMQQPVYPNAAMPQGYAVPVMPGYPQMPFGQIPVQSVMAVPGYPYSVTGAPQSNFFAVPPAAKKTKNTKPPLFVGYSADGRQLFQTYDELGNPIPINEAVYSAPPEQPKHQPAPVSGGMPASGVPVMDLEDIMASMGIEDPKKKKVDEGKAINFTEYHIPEKKKKKAPAPKPASAMPDIQAPSGPVSAAEAKRRKKVDKINKEFEKQLRARGIDPKTGGIIIDDKK